MDRQTALIIVGLFADLVLVGQILIVIFALLFVASKLAKKNKFVASVMRFLSENALSLGFLVALVAMSGSLFFSEIAHFVPCKLCWYQRICMYPQVLLLGISAVKNDFKIKVYSMSLATIGLIIAIYHYVLQMSPIPLPCTDEVASCALKQTSYFGYITIPLMSATAFALIILLMLQIKKK
jgi:disulfide bond formation protein DsbB